jgi:hypothetical protein
MSGGLPFLDLDQSYFKNRYKVTAQFNGYLRAGDHQYRGTGKLDPRRQEFFLDFLKAIASRLQSPRIPYVFETREGRCRFDRGCVAMALKRNDIEPLIETDGRVRKVVLAGHHWTAINGQSSANS